MRTVRVTLAAAWTALVLGVGVPGRAEAAWSPPTPDQLGYAYYIFIECAYEGTGDSALPAMFAYATIAPYATNAATYAFCHSSLLNESNGPLFTANVTHAFYTYLAYVYGRENYLNPGYAELVQSFYASYGQMVFDYYAAVSRYNGDYWKAGCDYYQSLIFPPSSQGGTTSGSTSGYLSGGTLQLSGGSVVHAAGVVDYWPGVFSGVGLGDFSTNVTFLIQSP